MAKRKQLKNTPKNKGKRSSKGKSSGFDSTSRKKNSKSISSFFGFTNWIKDEQTQRVFGLLLIGFSLFMLTAFVSYFFNWKFDQSIVLDSSQNVQQPSNAMGRIGAWLAHRFIYKGFGIAALFLVPVFFVVGVKLLYKKTFGSLYKIVFSFVFVSIWLSTLFGLLAANLAGGMLAGQTGIYFASQLYSWLGNIGAILFSTVVFLVFCILAFNASLRFKHLFERKSTTQQNNNNLHTITDEEVDNPDVYTHRSDMEQDKDKESVNGLEIDLEINETVDNYANQNSEANEDIGLEIDKNVPEKESGISGITSAEQLVEKYGTFDPKLDLPNYKPPELDLLKKHGDGEMPPDPQELETNKRRIVETLNNYKIGIAKIKATIGPTVTLYEIVPDAGVRISKIKNLEDDIALSLAALGIRIIAPIPGKGTIGIEVPNQNPEVVSMRDVLSVDKFLKSKYDLPIALGKTISNDVFITDLAKMPHLLMAGATGQGKSVGLNAILVSLLYKKHPAQIKFVLVDPKKVELNLYNKIEKHFLAKLPGEEDAIITDTKKVVATLNSLCIEMDNRYELLKNAQVRNLKEYNLKFSNRKLSPDKGHRYMPYIVLVIDEFADFIMTAGKEVEMPIARLAQLARAVGIHLIVATQRPSVNVITGTIKANFPGRIAFRCSSKVDSRTILDAGGADQLIGRGDMLFADGSDLLRLQCAFVDTPEVEDIAAFIGKQQGFEEALELPEFDTADGDASAGKLEAADRDELFAEAAKIIVQHQQGSASLLQRRLNLGYNGAGRIIDQMEAAGIVGPNRGSKAREVLVSDEVTLEQFLS